jgi:hypothetical protein
MVQFRFGVKSVITYQPPYCSSPLNIIKITQHFKKIAMKNLLIIFICLFYWQSVLAKQTLPIEGLWQIVSYQVVGYPAMSEAEMKNWIGKVAEFSPQKKAILRDSQTVQTCTKFNYQVKTENAEGYFLIGYKIKPHRLGIVEEEIQLVTIACQTESWLGKNREFVIISDKQMLSYDEGTIFFFLKQADSSKRLTKTGGFLLITPQSVGLLNPNSDFNKKTITQALPGYTIEKIAPKKENKEHFKLYREEEKRLMLIYPNNERKIDRIRIFDDRALAPAETKLGMTYTQVFRNHEKIIDCQAGINDRSGQTLCSFKNMSNIQYVFEQKSINGTDVSPIEALNQAKLVEIVWTANRSLIVEIPSPDRSPAPVISDSVDSLSTAN